MKFENKIMILKVEIKTNKDGIDYLLISFADTETGNTYNIVAKDMQYSSLKAFNMYNARFSLNSNKYGLSLSLESIENI